MKLTLAIRQGSNGPENRTFEMGRFTLGRDPNSDLPFTGPGSDSVSWKHAELSIREEGVFLKDVGSSNGTWLNGRQLTVETKVLDGDEIRLGQSGPSLKVENIETPHAAEQEVGEKTVLAEPAPVGDATADGPAERKADASPFAAQKKGGPPPMKAAGQAAAEQPAPSAAVDVPEPSSSQGDDGPRRSTTRALLIKMQKSQKGWRGLGIAAIAALCITVVVSLILFGGKITSFAKELAQTSGEVEGNKEKIEKGSEERQKDREELKKKIAQIGMTPEQIAEKYNKCVYFVVSKKKTSRGTLFIFGTAFCIDSSGLFGTNAHVAKPIADELGKGLEAHVYTQGGKKKYRIKSAVYHPDYRDPSSSAKTKQPDRRESPDVGILIAEVPDGEELDTVELAGDEEIRNLKKGARLCYIGFPKFLDDDYLGTKQTNYAKIESRVYAGHIVRMLTLKHEVGPQEKCLLLEHQMHSWGGASGSPIFNKYGRVVGLHFSANNVKTKVPVFLRDRKGVLRKIMVTQYVPSPASAKFGMRVDKLKEIIPQAKKKT